MSVSRLPSGRWRSQTYDPSTGKFVSSAKVLGLTEPTFATETKARRADAAAAKVLAARRPQAMTLQAWADRWTTDPLFSRPKESTNIHNRERIRAFVVRYGTLPLDAIDDAIVNEWIAGAKNLSTVPTLKAMFNDAASARGGRIIQVNPFAGLRLSKGKGRKHAEIPDEDRVWAIIGAARRLTGPSLAAWLQVGAFTGMRPGELDALRWDSVDFANGEIRVVEQFNTKTRTITLPKNGLCREAPLTQPAREALLSAQGFSRSPFCFVSFRNTHWTASARAYHWKAIKAATEYEGDFYEAGRHFAGWYMTNVLDLPAEDVAIALGHTDGGHLVRTLYGHRDHKLALERVRRAYERTGVVQLRAVKEDAS
jgi:integrase